MACAIFDSTDISKLVQKTINNATTTKVQNVLKNIDLEPSANGISFVQHVESRDDRNLREPLRGSVTEV